MRSHIKRLWVQVTHNRKRFGIMCTLLVVSLLLWGRLIILQDVPRTGYATPEDTPEATASAADSSETAALEELPVKEVEFATEPRRNIFMPSDWNSSQSSQLESTPLLTPKSDSDPSDVENRDARHAARIRQEGEALRLDSLLLGARPIAVINGNVITIGDAVDGFVLEKVLDWGVVLVKENVRVELKRIKDAPGSNGN